VGELLVIWDQLQAMVVLEERLPEGRLACHFDRDIPWGDLLLQEDEVQMLQEDIQAFRG